MLWLFLSAFGVGVVGVGAVGVGVGLVVLVVVVVVCVCHRYVCLHCVFACTHVHLQSSLPRYCISST